MYRKSSKGNPYHDALGRFTSAGGKGKGGVREGDKKPVLWSSFGEQENVSDLSIDQRIELDINNTNDAIGKRFYHNQSITREKRAKNLADVKLKNGLTSEEKQKAKLKAAKDFRKENKPALDRGAEVVVYVKGNANRIMFQIVESHRMAKETRKSRSSVVRNTASSMKVFTGHGVEFTSGNKFVRSCRQGATMLEAQEHFTKFAKKYKSELSNKNVLIKVWNEKGRIRYMPTYVFDTEEEAKSFAENFKGARVVDYDDGDLM